MTNNELPAAADSRQPCEATVLFPCISECEMDAVRSEAHAEIAASIERVKSDCTRHGAQLDDIQADAVDRLILVRVLTARKHIEDIVSANYSCGLGATLEEIRRQ